VLLQVYQLQKEDENNCSLLLNIVSDLVTKDRKRPRYLIPFFASVFNCKSIFKTLKLMKLVRKTVVMKISQVRELLNKKDRSVWDLIGYILEN